MSKDDQSCDNMDEDAVNEDSVQSEEAAAPKGNLGRPARGAKRRGRGRPRRNEVKNRDVGKTSETAKKSSGVEAETRDVEERDSDGDTGSVDNEIRSSARLSGVATRRSSGVTYEEPPDSAVSEDGSSLGKNNENNGVNRAGSPSSSNGADHFLGFSLVDDRGVNARDNGSEAGSESEAAPVKSGSKERDVQRRGRGKKRGRKKRSPDFPPEVVSTLPDYLRQELQYAFEIYSALRTVSKVGPFLDKPLSNMYGMSTYSCVIKTPMYLYEVKRKLLCHGYNSLSEFISDIRLMLENCYIYWGTDHAFSRVALQLESKLEQKIDSLPSKIKDKCKDIALDGVDANDLLKMEVDDFRSYSEENNEISKTKPKVLRFSSKILCKLYNNGVQIDKPLPAVDKEREELIVAWEGTHLTTPDIKHQISSVWEIAAIGLFLNTAHEHLNLTKISQYEIERMLLIPKESLTLANIMTSLLSSSTKRTLLDPTVPVMSYQVWNERLRKRVEEWFNVYYTKNGSESEVFSTCGVEPNFWKTMSYMNHFEDKNFSDITYHQRCSILKAICDNLCCSSKSLQDLFTSDSKTEPTEETVLGCLNQFVYYYVPFWPDFRVYRVKALLPSQVNSTKNLSILSNKLIKYSMKESCQEITDGSRADLFEGFYLVADSREELSNNVEKIKCLNSELASNLTAFSDRVDKLSTSYLPTLSVMYEQWFHYASRKKHFDDQSIAYWCNEVNSDRGYFNVDDPDILGKRKRSIKCSAMDNNYSSSEEEVEDIFDKEDDGSDWECPSEKKKTIKRDKQIENADESEDKEDSKIKRKKRPAKPPKPKKTRADSTEKTRADSIEKTRADSTEKTKDDTSDSSLNKSTVVIDKVKSLVDDNLSIDKNIPSFGNDIIIKTEPCEDIVIKTEAYDNIKIGGDEVHIKKEKEDKEEEKKVEVLDVISLSSQEEEDDDDVILTTPVKEMPKPVPLVTTPVRSPVVPNNVPRTPLRTPPIANVRSPRVATPGTPTSSPRMNFTTSPRLQPLRMSTPSPRLQTTPRQRLQSPNSFSPSPTGFNTSARMRPPLNKNFPTTPPKAGPAQVSRNLFNNARAPQPQPQPQNAQTTKKTITAKLTFGKRDDGSYGYLARLPDGGVINMSPQQIESIRKKNGTIPPLINIPIG